MSLLSVIIPNYNHAEFLKKRIDSVINQTFNDFEIIILDDHSTDNSREIINSYKNNSKISHIIFNETNSGSTFYQWNKGINLAKGKYIWIAESDDYCENEFLEYLIPKIEKFEDCIIAYCQSYKIDSKNNITGDWKYVSDFIDKNKFCDEFYSDGNEFVAKYLVYRNVIPNASAVIFRKDKYIQIGLADTNLKQIGDWDVWLRMLTKGVVYFTDKRLNYFRLNERGVSQSVTNISNTFKNEVKLRIKINKNYLFNTKIRKINNKLLFDLRVKISLNNMKNKIKKILNS